MPVGFESDHVWGARSRGFQMGVIQTEGATIHLTGQVSWDRDENIVGLGDVQVQARQCFENIAKLLEEVGGHFNDVVAITTYFTDRAQLPLIQEVRREIFRDDRAPASTSVMVAGLGHEDFLVEFAPIAVIPFARFIAPSDR